MYKLNARYVILLAAGVLLLAMMYYLHPKDIDWSEHYGSEYKMPLGCYVLEHELEKAGNVTKNTKSIYQAIFDDSYENARSLIFVTYLFSPDELDLDQIIRFASHRGDVFIAATDFSKNVCDSFGIDVSYHFPVQNLLKQDSAAVRFANPHIDGRQRHFFKNDIVGTHFTNIDTLHTEILGYDDQKQPNLIRIAKDSGFVYLCCTPGVFSNYGILYNDSAYAFRALSYLKQGPMIWDEYYKPNNIQGEVPLRIILKDKALKSAYYILLLGLILYIIFTARRRQRAIPVVLPPVNNTLEFTETIGRLYFQNRDHRDLCLKKFTHFQEHILMRYYMKYDGSNQFFHALALKSLVDEDMIRTIYKNAESIQKSTEINELQMSDFIKRINRFYKQTK